MDNIDKITIPSPQIEMLNQLKSPLSTDMPFSADPISMILMLPLMPIVMLIQAQQTMLNQLFNFNNNTQKGKVTQIIRDKDALTIIEKYL